MKITSSVFEDNKEIPQKYACDGQGINPPLTFSDIPKETKSLALIMDDPDAPMGTFVHWVAYNIPPTTKEISEDSFIRGAIMGKNSTGKKEYTAPCPPSGTHRYFFKLYALDTSLTLSIGADKSAVEDATEGHIVATAQLVGLYSKK